MKTKLLILFAAIGISFATQVYATELYMQPADVTKWRIQTYTGVGVDQLSMWFTGSNCTNGGLSFPSTVPAEKNRFWSTVVAAKLSKKLMFISYLYDSAANTCVISSYALLEE